MFSFAFLYEKFSFSLPHEKKVFSTELASFKCHISLHHSIIIRSSKHCSSATSLLAMLLKLTQLILKHAKLLQFELAWYTISRVSVKNGNH